MSPRGRLIDVIVSESTDPSAVLRQTRERLLSTPDIQNISIITMTYLYIHDNTIRFSDVPI